MNDETTTDPPRGDPAGGAGIEDTGRSHLGSRDMELDFLDSRLRPETRELLAVFRALCRMRYLGIPDVLYSPYGGNC
jgi:hypothetical protein